jgi:hypothetical protein
MYSGFRVTIAAVVVVEAISADEAEPLKMAVVFSPSSVMIDASIEPSVRSECSKYPSFSDRKLNQNYIFRPLSCLQFVTCSQYGH